MSALKLAVSALNRDKPHVSTHSPHKTRLVPTVTPKSSITDWVEILTSPTYPDEAFDGYVFFHTHPRRPIHVPTAYQN